MAQHTITIEDTGAGLVAAASVFAMRGAAEYLRLHKLQAEDVALAVCVRSWIKIKLPGALHDAKQALDCNMGQVAEATFAASMVQAGIEAAMEAGCRREVV